MFDDFMSSVRSGASNAASTVRSGASNAASTVGGWFGRGQSNPDPMDLGSPRLHTTLNGIQYDQYGRQIGGGSSGTDDAMIAAWQESLAGPQTQQAPIPRMIDFDRSGAMKQGRKMAERDIAPSYKKLMDNFLKKQSHALQGQKLATSRGIEDIQTNLGQLKEDTATSRERTQEDTEREVTGMEAAFDAQDRQGSEAFDEADRALSDALTEGNAAETGLGRQQQTQQQRQYRDMSNEQIRQLDDKVEASNILMNRTFDDLTRQEDRATDAAGTQIERLEVDLERFIELQDIEKLQEEMKQSRAKSQEVAQATQANTRAIVNEWLDSLSGQGYTADEVALASQIYGR